MNKSCIYGVGVAAEEIGIMARRLGTGVGEFPFKYLGLPIRLSMWKIEYWKPIIEKFRKWLFAWKVRMMSF